ncbi:hypothetical protein [Halalkalibacter krulwichiae]|uniref:hypothetical protein n=1 Tax=Halalkalibacter krulwichiae TaxID=199441 RepID=UPI001C55B6E4|nr:hypothetical protein [Halalkalibacter krulwichiae]
MTSNRLNELRILSPLGILGYGFSEESFYEGLRRNPHFIGIDAGSTDGGPQKLGLGVGVVSKQAVKKDLSIILKNGKAKGIPVVIGSSGALVAGKG